MSLVAVYDLSVNNIPYLIKPWNFLGCNRYDDIHSCFCKQTDEECEFFRGNECQDLGRPDLDIFVFQDKKGGITVLILENIAKTVYIRRKSFVECSDGRCFV
jgi:hypothetical protein